MAAEFQALTVILLLVIVKFCQLAVYPYLRPALPKIYYGLAYPVSILLLTLISTISSCISCTTDKLTLTL